MRLLAPAKINLHLRVAAPTADGFHPLLTWMATVGLCDTLDVSPAAGPAPVVLTCDDASLPTDSRNLVVKAAELLAARAAAEGHRVEPVRVALTKRVPAGGGLGGGSSDAARVLLGLNRWWRLGWDGGRLSDVAGLLGSDVPFFIHGPSSACTGRGEKVQPIDRPALRWALLILPAFAMPTPAVYRRFDAMKLGRTGDVEEQPDWTRWARLPAAELLRNLVNDLEPPAFDLSPELAALRAECQRRLRRPVRMSGSGSTLFTLYDGRDEAEAAVAEVRSASVGAVVAELAPVVEDDLKLSPSSASASL